MGKSRVNLHYFDWAIFGRGLLTGFHLSIIFGGAIVTTVICINIVPNAVTL